MQTTITARHFEISDSLQERAAAVLAKLESTAPRPIDAHVVFDIEGATPTAEIRLHLSQGEMMVAIITESSVDAQPPKAEIPDFPESPGKSP